MEKEKIRKLLKRYKGQKKEKEEYLEGWKRAKADLENYKKKERERMESFAFQEKKDMLLKILPVLDNFKRAKEEYEKEEGENEVVEGFLRIKKQLEDVLFGEGLREIRALGEEFDPEYHEAIEMVEDKEKESGEVVEELETGYLLGEKVIRPTKVKVNK